MTSASGIVQLSISGQQPGTQSGYNMKEVMPTRMLERVICDVCRNHHWRRNMSAFDGVCNSCFSVYYIHCTNCGEFIRQRDCRYGPGSSACYLNQDRERQTPLCHPCWQAAQSTPWHSVSWQPTPLDVSIATYQRIRSKRKFGVEVETSRCDNHNELHGKTKFGCKTDCSVSGMEFPSPVLYGDEGFAEIEKLLDFAGENDWRTDYDCGCHTHYDMRDESDEQLYRIAYAYAKTYRFWANCVSNSRRGNYYCHEPQYTLQDIRCGAADVNFKHFSFNYDRYDYVNLTAYGRHNTFEVRLLEGTVDAETICNWVSVHARFMDYVRNLSFSDLDLFLAGQSRHVFSAVAKIVDETSINDWLARRIDDHGCPV